MKNSRTAVHGVYRDQLVNSAGKVVYDSGWRANTIVAIGHMLLAALMRGDARAKGIQWLQVGRGLPEWDINPKEPLEDITDLIDPYSNPIKLIAENILYLDDNGNNPDPDKQNRRLQIRAELGDKFPKDGTCELREFGLFGEFEGKPCMINCVRHKLITKESSEKLVRVMRLYF